MSAVPRLATMGELAAVRALVHAAYAHYVPRIGIEPGPMRDDYAPLIRDGRVYVVGAPRALQAVLVLIPQPDAMLLDNIAVAPAAQGQGYGRLLLQFAEQMARQAGFRSIRLYTHEKMVENLALYARIGYRETHRVHERGLARVYMLKDLAARP
ncbi:GNAT family N-acetyltransferase [Bordetella genomosp. 2]|uniref:GNAT family N-acetyltransferase n=1 Tax=Bordetella genomosp. 2 TaxID=1983456 RepID=A0A261W0Y4_9BORD|nr:GNAT family N-acetyltransferase [Bordetella genomosp. 2]OZI79687.1 GNAT family N-acetyltransferase [Bordetella genomosp. 2]